MTEYVGAPHSRWTVIDNEPSQTFPIYGRGNMGEVYPNVMTPLSGSLVYLAARLGQESVILDLGFLSQSHLDDSSGATTGVFGGYLYANLSMFRVGAARAPGLTVADIDVQMFGLSDAPPHVARPDDRNLRCTLRLARKTMSALLRPDRGLVERSRAAAESWIASLPPLAGADDAQLIETAHRLAPKFEEMMGQLLRVSSYAGISRTIIERLTEGWNDIGLVNRLTAGLGTIESAEPAMALWQLGRIAANSPELTKAFDGGLVGLADRFSSGSFSEFESVFAQFLTTFGSRGPDEWEIGSPTWGTDPSIALAAIDRLRLSPVDRDPAEARKRLAADRRLATQHALKRLRGPKRAMLRRALDTAALYATAREATKATFVRCLYPVRVALHELARRHDIERSDLFLMTIDELPEFLRDPAQFAEALAERRQRRDWLQARVPPFWFEAELPHPDTWELRSAQLRPDPTPRTLRGLGVCAGTATGTARVITNPASPDALSPGDILIAPITDPAWTPLFLAVAGVVVDVGAQLSHAAIVARELGIPAVVSVVDASLTIPDGTTVTVDGTAGTVIIHS